MLREGELPQFAPSLGNSGGTRMKFGKFKQGLFALSVLGASATMAIAADDAPKKLILGVGDANSEYWQEMIWGVTQVMKSVGGEVEVIVNDFDPQKSIQNMSAIVAGGCEGCIFIWFPDSGSITNVLTERVAQVNGFITTLWNRPEASHPWDTSKDNWVANISFDGVYAGYANGMALCKALNGKGNIVVLKGIPDNAPAIQRSLGLQNALKECPGMTVLDEQVGSWQQQPAQDITRTWLVKYGDQINGIFGMNDAMGLGAVAALREVGKVGIPVTGTDGSSDVIELIKKGEMLSTVKGLNETQGAVAAAITYAVRVGDVKLADLTEAQRDFNIEQLLVTKENADAVLAAKPDPADFTYEKIKADLWGKSAGQIAPGMN
jgi:ribose transport system substrate-binding protein